MGRKSKEPPVIVAPVSSKKQLMTIDAVCLFLGGMSHDTLRLIRDDAAEGFPKPLQMTGNTPRWSVEQIERYIDKKTKAVSQLSA